MKIMPKRKLTLSRETVRSLTGPELAGVAGGSIPYLSRVQSCVYTLCYQTCDCPATTR
jgi:hypothetical protein